MKLEIKPICAPSILSADFTDITAAINLVEQSGCPWLHLDIMDGNFVPNLTFGLKMVEDIRKKSRLFLDTHLMISNPEDYVNRYIDAGADAVTFHLEAAVHTHRVIRIIKDTGAICGISIVPSTPVSALEEVLDEVDLVLIMSVDPGFGGQVLIPRCLDKIARLDGIRKKDNLDFLISVDGGVNRDTSKSVIDEGADILVVGSAFFGASDPVSEVQYLLG